jgi:pyruvate,water dikinase
MAAFRYIRFLDELDMGDVARVGGKNASLGEMVQGLASHGIKVPGGYATTADAYRHYLKHNGLVDAISGILAGLDTRDVAALAAAGASIRNRIAHADMPPDLDREIAEAYARLQKQEGGGELSVAVRSSATAEDLPGASFAGQQETYLNINGAGQVSDTIKLVFASLFTNRAISYRVDQGFAHTEVALSACVQKMVRSDLACAGVMFSIDTETGFPDAVLISAAYGLGENVVQGAVSPDEYYVFKPTLGQAKRPVLSRSLGEKSMKMVFSTSLRHPTKNVKVPAEEQRRFCLTDEELLTLARHAVAIEEHYSARAGHVQPMDIEWAKDGITGELYIVQARPETVHAHQQTQVMENYHLQGKGPLLVQGKSVGKKIAAGTARIIKHVADIGQLKPGEVLVTDMTDPDWEPIMKIAAAIVTNRGGRTCHAAIVSRELGLPAVVGAATATADIPDGTPVTVSCAEGETGNVYQGALDFDIEQIPLDSLSRPKTKIMMNVASPEQAFGFSRIPNDGVGLARLEFIINNAIGIHPNALLNLDRLDPPLRAEILMRTAAYADPVEYYVERLAEGVAMIGAAFHPKPVIVRMSDFKSNEYANLLGGRNFEPTEDNPMIGYRGASRYYSEGFRDAFALECRAMKRVREDKGLTNVALMIPFTRTTAEGDKVLAEMKKHGLVRGENGLSIYVMCEIPANVIAADAFLDRFDGFSIGSNDLTQLTLGVDRDSGLVAHVFDEHDPAVKTMLSMAIAACLRRQKYVGICGQAPSDFPDIAAFLVEEGIASLSLNPDSVLATTMHVLEVEKGLPG